MAALQPRSFQDDNSHPNWLSKEYPHDASRSLNPTILSSNHGQQKLYTVSEKEPIFRGNILQSFNQANLPTNQHPTIFIYYCITVSILILQEQKI